MAIDTAKGAVIRHRILRNTASNFIGKLITLGIALLLTPFIVHQLGAVHYGLWVLVGSVVGYGSLLDLGIGGAVIKYVAEYRTKGDHQQAHSLIATALSLYSILGIIVVALSVILAPVFPDVFNVRPNEQALASALVLLSGIIVGISIPCSLSLAVLRGLQRFDLANFISTGGTLLSFTAIITILHFGGGVLDMVAVNIPVILAMQLLSVRLINRVAPNLQFGWRGAKRSLVRMIISFSSSLFVIDVAGRLQTRTDEIVIGAFLPISFITPYSLARRLSEVAQVMAAQFMKVLLPVASELHAENARSHLRALYITSSRLTLALLIPVGCTIIILARATLGVWVGPEYAKHGHLVAILTLGSLIVSSQWPAAFMLQAMARHRLLAVSATCSGLANLALSIALLHKFGLTGVALGTLIPTAAECFGFVLPYAMRVIGVSAAEVLKQIFLPALVPAIPMTILLYVLQQAIEPSSLVSILVVAGTGVLVYIVGYLSVGATKVERQTCRSFAMGAVRFVEARFTQL